MTNNEDDKPAASGKDAGGSPGSMGTSESSKSGASEDTDRVGTKADIRGADSKKTDGETTTPDKLRDGN